MKLKHFFADDQVYLGGQVEYRLKRAIGRFLKDDVWTPEFVSQDSRAQTIGYRKFSEWHGDISGRHIGLMSSAKHAGEAFDPALDEIVERVLSEQLSDGTYGYLLGAEDDGSGLDNVAHKKIYGHGRLLLGLAEYYGATKRPEVLEAALAIARFYEANIDAVMAHGTMQQQNFFLQALDGVVQLIHHRPNDEWLRSYAKKAIALVWRLPDNSAELPGVHAHAYASTLRGILDYVIETGDDSVMSVFWERYQRAWPGVTLDGNYTEVFNYQGTPFKPRNEACGIADWIMIHLRLAAIEGDDRYFAIAENSLYNALFATQFPNYGFGHRWYLGGTRALGYVTEGEEAWWCCSYHGPRSLVDLKRFVYAQDGDAVDVNFLFSSEIKTRDFSLCVDSGYPQRGDVSITVGCIAPVRRTLRIRIPPFVDPSRIDVSVNGKAAKAEVVQGRLTLDREWNDRDRVLFTVPLELRLVNGRSGDVLAEAEEGRMYEECSIAYGPLYLGFTPPTELALDDQLVVLPSAAYGKDGALDLPAFSWKDDGLDTGAALSPGANIYGLVNEGLHRLVGVESRDGSITRGRDLYPENEATRRYSNFRVVFPVVIR
mgnify:FL=1